MLARIFERRRFDSWPKPIFVQPKLEGERCRVLLNQGRGEWHDNVRMLSSTELELVSMPHIARELYEISNYIDGEAYELDGELYSHELKFEDIASRVSRSVNLHSNYGAISYYIFDLPSSTSQTERGFQLDGFKDGIETLNLKYIKVVPTYKIDDYDSMLFHLKMFIEQGYEGIILRHKDGLYERKKSVYMMKLKPTKKDEYKIVGYKEEVSIDGVPKNALGAFICVDKENQSFKVGTGRVLTRYNRVEFWKRKDELLGETLVVKYQHLTDGKKIPYSPVALEVKGWTL